MTTIESASRRIMDYMAAHNGSTVAFWLNVGDEILSVRPHVETSKDWRGNEVHATKTAIEKISHQLGKWGCPVAQCTLYVAAKLAGDIPKDKREFVIESGIPLRDVRFVMSRAAGPIEKAMDRLVVLCKGGTFSRQKKSIARKHYAYKEEFNPASSISISRPFVYENVVSLLAAIMSDIRSQRAKISVGEVDEALTEAKRNAGVLSETKGQP